MKSLILQHLILTLVLIYMPYELELVIASEPAHDVAITKVVVLPQGPRDYTIPIVIDIKNQGKSKETFEVKLIDTTEGKGIGIRSTTLPVPGRGGIDGDCDLIFTGEKSGGQNFGDWIDVGDANGDDYDDLLVSAAAFRMLSSKRPRTHQNIVATTPGRAYLFYGGKEMDIIPDKVFTGENVGDAFSDGDICLADMNNDGFDDVIVGARFFKDRGRVYIFYGGRDMDENPDVIIEADEGVMNSSFGRGVTVGDVNGDGYNDLFVAAPGVEDIKGCAYLFYGGKPFDTTFDKRFIGENTQDGFAHKMCACGDVDGDGCDDLLIGTRFWPSMKNTGRAYLFYGGPGTTMDETCDVYFDADSPRSEFGSGIGMFDIDKDGYAEILIGARRWNRSQGRVYLYWGNSREAMDNVADLCFEGEIEATAAFGSGCVAIGHIDKDDYGDIVIPAFDYFRYSQQGRAYFYYGNTEASTDTTCDQTLTPEGTQNQPHRIRIGDFNGDGYGDVVMGAWEFNKYQGRCYLWYGGPGSSTAVTFYWDTTTASPGNHTLKVEIPPVPGEQNTEDNIKTVTIEIKETRR